MSTHLGTTPVSATAGKYLTFCLGRESYAIPVLKVREIIKLVPITSIPQVPDYIKGVINLRGKIIPVIDLRLRFGFPTGMEDSRTCIIVVQVARSSQAVLQMGLIVDAVEEVANITPAEIEATPEFGTEIDTTFIIGMAKIKGAVKILIDIDRIVGFQQLLQLPQQ